MLRRTCLLTLFASLLALPASRAIVLIGGDLPAHRVAPPNGAPWSHVAKLGENNGSGVYLGKRFVLTANHVPFPSFVRIDGVQYGLDTAWGERQVGGDDLKLIRIDVDPGLPSLKLIGLANEDLGKKSTLIGWGLGNGTEEPAQGWLWAEPRKQRWATNVTLSTLLPNGQRQRLAATFDLPTGPTEGAAAQSDSGGALFQKFEGVWKLAGLIVDAETHHGSYYDNNDQMAGAQPDRSYFIRIKDHRAAIKQIMASAEP